MLHINLLLLVLKKIELSLARMFKKKRQVVAVAEAREQICNWLAAK